MTRSFKAVLGFSLMVALAAILPGAMSASATVSGHFVSTSGSGTKFRAVEATGSGHETVLSSYGSTIGCHHVTYHIHHLSSATVQSLTLTPTYANCTTGSEGGAMTVRMNGCHYQISSQTAGTGHGTFKLICPVGKKLELETSSGLQKYGAQTPTSGGVTYTNLANGTITANLTAEGLHAECHGLCQFLGTNTTTAKWTGAFTIEALDTVTGSTVSLTAT